MLVISWNINGLRSRFGELKQLVAVYDPDFVCLQKVRCDFGSGQFDLEGYRTLHTDMDSGKWSGVVTYAKIPTDVGARAKPISIPERVDTPELSIDGHLQVFLCSGFALVNAYAPFSNPVLEGAVQFRRKWDEKFREFIRRLSAQMPIVACGDLNVVHTIKDTCDKRLERQRPCFYKWERDNFDLLLTEADLVDVYREINPDDVVPTFYGNYRHTGIGNRIDYFLISRPLLRCVAASDILTDFGTGQSVPIVLDLNPDASALPPGHITQL